MNMEKWTKLSLLFSTKFAIHTALRLGRIELGYRVVKPKKRRCYGCSRGACAECTIYCQHNPNPAYQHTPVLLPTKEQLCLTVEQALTELATIS